MAALVANWRILRARHRARELEGLGERYVAEVAGLALPGVVVAVNCLLDCHRISSSDCGCTCSDTGWR
jgi:hypothetical protein